jgi:hypothetical protein
MSVARSDACSARSSESGWPCVARPQTSEAAALSLSVIGQEKTPIVDALADVLSVGCVHTDCPGRVRLTEATCRGTLSTSKTRVPSRNPRATFDS